MPGIPPAKFVGWLVTLPLSLQGGPSVPGKDYVYRVTRQVSDLGWVDSDLASSLILLGQ